MSLKIEALDGSDVIEVPKVWSVGKLNVSERSIASVEDVEPTIRMSHSGLAHCFLVSLSNYHLICFLYLPFVVDFGAVQTSNERVSILSLLACFWVRME